jgi:hypothetical protein
MASPITGTTAWTADASENASYVGGTGGDASFRHARFAVNPARTFAYCPCRNGTDKVLRLTLTGANAGKYEILYGTGGIGPATGLGAGAYACHVSDDNATLYLLKLNGGTVSVYSLAADGSTDPFPAASHTYSSGSASSVFKAFKDPTLNRLFHTNGGDKPQHYTVPGTWANDVNLRNTLSTHIFLACTGFDQGGRYVFAGPTDGDSYAGVYAMERTAERWMRLVGTGGGVTAVNADPWEVGTGPVEDVCGDDTFEVSGRGVCTNGNLYYADGSNNIRRRDVNGVASVITGAYAREAGLVYVPTDNFLLVGDSAYVVRKVT